MDLARAGVDVVADAVAATRDGIDTLLGDEEARLLRRLDRMPSSVDNMAPGSPFIETLADIQLDRRVRVHSIIPVRGGPPPEGQNDGVVTFESARIPSHSEVVVFHSDHSVQSNPVAIQEVRRILLTSLESGSGRAQAEFP